MNDDTNLNGEELLDSDMGMNTHTMNKLPGDENVDILEGDMNGGENENEDAWKEEDDLLHDDEKEEAEESGMEM